MNDVAASCGQGLEQRLLTQKESWSLVKGDVGRFSELVVEMKSEPPTWTSKSFPFEFVQQLLRLQLVMLEPWREVKLRRLDRFLKRKKPLKGHVVGVEKLRLDST